jgi:hypothetical protein
MKENTATVDNDEWDESNLHGLAVRFYSSLTPACYYNISETRDVFCFLDGDLSPSKGVHVPKAGLKKLYGKQDVLALKMFMKHAWGIRDQRTTLPRNFPTSLLTAADSLFKLFDIQNYDDFVFIRNTIPFIKKGLDNNWSW